MDPTELKMIMETSLWRTEQRDQDQSRNPYVLRL